ncbi:MAG: hypothetical protein LBP95_00300 [Deltaproteobacteria bacterium]|nr:hypothetical protein [Deltaproteobacteria bacterium]
MTLRKKIELAAVLLLLLSLFCDGGAQASPGMDGLPAASAALATPADSERAGRAGRCLTAAAGASDREARLLCHGVLSGKTWRNSSLKQRGRAAGPVMNVVPASRPEPAPADGDLSPVFFSRLGHFQSVVSHPMAP